MFVNSIKSVSDVETNTFVHSVKSLSGAETNICVNSIKIVSAVIESRRSCSAISFHFIIKCSFFANIVIMIDASCQ